MIFVTLPSNGREIGIRFEHQFVKRPVGLWASVPNANYKGPAKAAADKRTTVCQIRDASRNPATPITQAEVVWNPLDRYSRLTGQKRALTMVLNYLVGLGVCTAADRAAVWHAFWAARKPQPAIQQGTSTVEATIVSPGATVACLEGVLDTAGNEITGP